MTNDPDDRCCVPTQLILDVIRAHGGAIRFGCYVPTRREVAEVEPGWLSNIMLDWWWESPSELIPTDEQVTDVLAILRARPDVTSARIQETIAQAPPPEDGA